VCIVGGGFAGLWTAVRLTERDPSLRIALVEQDIVGGGASGRNGGFFSSSWWDLGALIGLFGEAEACGTRSRSPIRSKRPARSARPTGSSAGGHHDGTLGVRSGEWQDGIGRSDAIELCRRLGFADRMVPLDAAEVGRTRTRRRSSAGPSSGTARSSSRGDSRAGLRRVLLERGVRIYERSP
jgi:glycine/D-amino acid oxidase-like deaminating enzyme